MLWNAHSLPRLLLTVACGLVLVCPCSIAADGVGPEAEGIVPDSDTIIRKLLGFDAMAKNVCLIDSHQMVNAGDLPGRLVAISTDRQVPSDLLRFSFRRQGAETRLQVNPPTQPIQVTRLESSVARKGSLFNWLGASMSQEDIAELRTIPLPATSISVDDLDEEMITQRFSTVPADVRRGLGIITDVIPYEIWASVCKKVTKHAEAGIWYIKLGNDTYCRHADELRRYYLVAVYTPLVFYDDIGVFSNSGTAAEVPERWQENKGLLSRSELLDMWMERPEVVVAADFDTERTVAWDDGVHVAEPPNMEPPDIAPPDSPPQTGNSLTNAM